MSTLLPSIGRETIRGMAKRRVESARKRGLRLGHAEALEDLAHDFGFESWNHFSALLGPGLGDAPAPLPGVDPALRLWHVHLRYTQSDGGSWAGAVPAATEQEALTAAAQIVAENEGWDDPARATAGSFAVIDFWEIDPRQEAAREIRRCSDAFQMTPAEQMRLVEKRAVALMHGSGI